MHSSGRMRHMPCHDKQPRAAAAKLLKRTLRFRNAASSSSREKHGGNSILCLPIVGSTTVAPHRRQVSLQAVLAGRGDAWAKELGPVLQQGTIS